MLKCLLAPAAFLYKAGVTFRHRLFDWGILKSEKFDIPIICIGNITVGGTGKTPMAEMVIAYMSQMHNVALLSRGYGRRTKGYREVRCDSHYRDVGDEPLQIKLKFPDTVVAVCEKRSDGIRRICAEHPEVDLIVMDDGFQPRYVEPKINVVMIDATRPIQHDRMLPLGTLRDLPEELHRAHYFVVTKCPERMAPIDRRILRKVLIQDSFDDLLPRYLSFIVGVVDSDDLPLNVSREQLSQDKVLKVMGKKIVRKAIEMIKKLAEEEAVSDAEKEAKAAEAAEKNAEAEAAETEVVEKPEDNANYIELWEQFGKSLKIGVIEDSANRNKLARLLRYKSSKSGEKWTSLEHYVERMKDWQKQIYYVSADSLEKAQSSMFLETFKRRDVEVLFFTEPIDEYVAQNLREFNGKTLQDITKEGVELGDDKEHEKKLMKEYETRFETFTKWLKELLGDKVEKVELSLSLESTPAVLATSRYGYSATMERIMRSQTMQNPEKAKYMRSRKIMEINPRHPIITNLKNLVEEDPESDVARDFANLLYDSSLMNSGFMIDDVNDFAGRLYALMKESLQIDSLELEPEIELPAEEEEEKEEKEEDDGSIKFDMKDGEQMDEDEFRAQLKKDREQNEGDEEDEL